MEFGHISVYTCPQPAQGLGISFFTNIFEFQSLCNLWISHRGLERGCDVYIVYTKKKFWKGWHQFNQEMLESRSLVFIIQRICFQFVSVVQTTLIISLHYLCILERMFYSSNTHLLRYLEQRHLLNLCIYLLTVQTFNDVILKVYHCSFKREV